MKTQLIAKFQLPKWSLFVLLGLFIFLSGAPSSLSEQKVPVQTEQRDEPRSVKTLHSVEFHQPGLQNNFLPETGFSLSLLHYSISIEVIFKNRTGLVLLFAPIGINLIANFLPRSNDESLFLIQG